MGHNVDLVNLANGQYTGSLTIGDSEAKKLVFDTGSNWLTVTSDLCSDCSSQAYNT